MPALPFWPVKILLLSTFTVDPLRRPLTEKLAGLVESVDFVTGPFGQVIQPMISGEYGVDEPDVVLVWPSLEDVWSGLATPLADDPEPFVERLLEIVDAAIDGSRRLGATLVFVLPSIPLLRPLGVGDLGNPTGVAATAARARLAAIDRLASARALTADAEDAVCAVGRLASHEERFRVVAKMPYTRALFAGVAAQVARLLELSMRGAKKVAVLDVDNTLWGGTIGEVGPNGIDLLDNGPGEAFREMQRFMLDLRRAGLLLTLASKNDEDAVWEGFERPEMVLGKNDLAGWQINWNPKSDTIQALARSLNLGLAEFVFVDDHPSEIGEVHERLPEITVLRMPEDPADWRVEIAMSGVFDRLPPTTEDLDRARSYAQEAQRVEARAAMTTEEFRRSLELVVTLIEPGASELGRLAQLIAKTNQFTLGGPRHTEAAIMAFLGDNNVKARVVQARDRFGDYGIVGAILVRNIDAVAVLDTFVLSCRAMGRGVEEAMLACAFELASPASLQVTIVTTPKNGPVREFFAALGVAADVAGQVNPVQWPAHIHRVDGKT